MKRGYWLDLFTWATWQEFVKAGSAVSGFRESRWKKVQKIQQGDYLLCYVKFLKPEFLDELSESCALEEL